MGRITSLFAHKVIRQVDDRLDERALLRGARGPSAGPGPAVARCDRGVGSQGVWTFVGVRHRVRVRFRFRLRDRLRFRLRFRLRLRFRDRLRFRFRFRFRLRIRIRVGQRGRRGRSYSFVILAW